MKTPLKLDFGAYSSKMSSQERLQALKAKIKGVFKGYTAALINICYKYDHDLLVSDWTFVIYLMPSTERMLGFIHQKMKC